MMDDVIEILDTYEFLLDYFNDIGDLLENNNE